MGPLLGTFRDDTQVTCCITLAPPVSRMYRASNGFAA
jgi:hypothetical protein